MKSVQKDYFSEKAKDYDTHKPRTVNVENIAQGILKESFFSKDMSIMDFGSGTGLLLTEVAPYVKKISAVDISTSMNEVLRSKKDIIECELELIETDLTKEAFNKTFDAIISSMTIHHIKNVLELFRKFYSLLNKNGFIAIADLDLEDGSFHTTDTGVFHFGFDREEFLNTAKKAGFKDLKIETVSVVEKPTGKYPVFLLTGRK
ncbi:class I SAM-dependent methyltransferase [Yeosuana marina]|uniref:class I SAM-dependent DNA methyltransferase n=1 Tax=Yeosuana marina TaxID=1565536 RepID=UPI0030ECB5CC|tara:strand:+ start:323 stop:934 length:612 start_codon:yes stop_codon:yes gene_type:complete